MLANFTENRNNKRSPVEPSRSQHPRSVAWRFSQKPTDGTTWHPACLKKYTDRTIPTDVVGTNHHVVGRSGALCRGLGDGRHRGPYPGRRRGCVRWCCRRSHRSRPGSRSCSWIESLGARLEVEPRTKGSPFLNFQSFSSLKYSHVKTVSRTVTGWQFSDFSDSLP